jgi:flavodoxin
MKAMIIYLSQTGNTEKIASAIYEEVSLSNETVLCKLDEVDPDSIDTYDQVFIGSPIHAGTIAKEIQDFLKKLPRLPGMRLAGFITHAATAYPKQTLEQMSQPFVDICRDKDMEYLGCFNCQGYLADFMHETVQKMQNASDEEWQEKVKRMTGHPNANDEADVKAFAIKSLKS